MLVTSRFRILAFMLAALIVSGCAPVTVRNVVDAPVLSNKATISLDDVRVAITRAGAGLGWVMLEDEPGKITGTLRLRTHVAVIDVTYDTSNYNLQYRDSTNLNYNPETNAIHKNYNSWIQNLDNAIRRELATL